MKPIARLLVGSHLYGLTTPTSDKDYAEILMPSLSEIVFDNKRITESITEDQDVKRYPLHHLVKLAFQGNPSVLEILWAPYPCSDLPCEPQLMDDPWQLVRSLRGNFLSKRIAAKFAGYALSESVKAFVVNGECGEIRRNEVLENGYQRKKVASCLRLCQEGETLLRTGELQFPLTDIKKIMDAKTGRMPADHAKAEMAMAILRLQDAAACTELPDDPFEDNVRRVVCDLIRNQ